MIRDHICGVLQKALLQEDSNQKLPFFFGSFNPLITITLRRALTEFLKAKETQEFLQSTEKSTRIAELKNLLQNNTIISKTGTPMTEILGEWV